MTRGHPGAHACSVSSRRAPGEHHSLHCQRHGAGALANADNLLFCPRARQPLPGSCPLGRERPDAVYISVGFLWGRGLGFRGKDLKWGGCRGSFCEQQLPSCWPEPIPASPKEAPLLPKLCPSAPCSWLWGKGREVDTEALGSWKCEPRAPLLCMLPCQGAPAGWECTGGCEGDTAGQLNPSDQRVQNCVWCNFTD